ncbi:Stb1p [Kluyveromyces lactis]|uniref:KLLA0E07283p n=1 Tax=Kluyveromyces lactis (strain ATCC 8585 / CBS 2359 / DSM 70799 / NBRC 1267 / NRRL Y-1140 / WM37) TaxID=284590 RepID=Q6CP62_KLULA|nr:uncharacterized protein KLLA0_E07283g [Kluyveromyces lactis]CAG99364.1 KLLA0E07283p [Kluyveromyces lactis]|eukprot:XP_454277.1 uncharacterized protein KLLA0_E07283g [Kluyveromyces lactis]
MSSLSPKKQQELADKILERAELAQMARKLKLGLSKVASPKKSNPSNVALGNRNKKGNSSGPDSVNIPTSAGRSRARSVSKPNHISESPTRRSAMKPPSRNNAVDGSTAGNTFTSSFNATERKTKNLDTRMDHLTVLNGEKSADDSSEPAVPSTPKASSSQLGSDSKVLNEEGADLLMYLATSPYASANHPSSSGRRPSASSNYGNSMINHGIPSTPSSNAYINQTTVGPESQLNDIVRLSHMKERASSSSPQSTFKQPVMIPTNSMHDLMQSPSTSMFTSPRRRLTTDDQQLLVPGTPSRIGLSASSMTSDQFNDSQSKIGSLLKTPNFNMGDYVHTLFSPSPRIDTSSQPKE